MRKILLLVALLVAVTSQTFAQRNCVTMEHLENILQKNPEVKANMDAIENHTNAFIEAKKNKNVQALVEGVVTIPVVVHIVYNGAAENISDAQIASQMAVLNEDYRKMNADVGNTPAEFSDLTADSQIEFVMATTDPDGNATDGITRTSSTKASYNYLTDEVKFDATGGKDAWPSDQYLNMWVCDISGGILGYAQFPGGPAATDGVVMDVLYFGDENFATPPFDLGRTATHEVGHWLNLRHIWGDGGCGVDDGVADTPSQGGSNFGCPTYPFVSCGTNDMFMNYMDYVDDFCMVMFSNGQKDRMRATFEPGGGRESFATPSGPCTVTVPTGLAASSISDTGATLTWGSVAQATTYNYRYRVSGTTDWTTSSTSATSATLSGLTASTSYEAQVNASCPDETSAYSGSSTFTTADEPVPCTVTAPAGLSVSGVTSDAATASWDAVAEATTYNYRYRVAGTATWIDGSTSSTSATLSGLSSETDYEVQVNAECPDETSAYSGSANFTTEVASTLEPCNIAPQNIHTTSNTATSTTIGWNAVENVNFYQFRYKPTGTNGWTNGTVTVNELVLNGLTANTAYEMNIRSNCSTGNSPVTSFTWTTDGGGGSTCDVPSGLSAGSVSETGATISWSGASGANSYNYQYRASGTTTWTTANTGSTSATLSGLTASTSYDYQVESVCTGETSGYSSTAIFTTTDGGGGGETSCDIAPQNITASTTGSTANIDWSPVEGATTYQYRYRSTGAFTNGTTTTNSLSLTGLSANTTYTLNVRSLCGSFSPVASFTFTTGSGARLANNRVFTEGVTLYPNPAEGL